MKVVIFKSDSNGQEKILFELVSELSPKQLLQKVEERVGDDYDSTLNYLYGTYKIVDLSNLEKV